MSKVGNILITGGAGFIGKRLAADLTCSGIKVAVFDNLNRQVHNAPDKTVDELQASDITFFKGDIRDSESILSAIVTTRANVIVHLAAETGTGQSYELPGHYCDVNVTGTARLVEAVRSARAQEVRVSRVVLASSRAVYGEGACTNTYGATKTAVPRKSQDLAVGDYTPKDILGNDLKPVLSSASTTQAAPASIYASSKLMQEHILQQSFEQSGVECGILRLQNVYGDGQALNNPYTGVLSIFAQQLLNGGTLRIFEDGEIVRDFVYVADVVDAFKRLCISRTTPSEILDIGTGHGTTILEVAQMMIKALNLNEDHYSITGEFRPGDIRHAVADITLAKELLEWEPHVQITEGLSRLLNWVRDSV